MTRDQK